MAWTFAGLFSSTRKSLSDCSPLTPPPPHPSHFCPSLRENPPLSRCSDPTLSPPDAHRTDQGRSKPRAWKLFLLELSFPSPSKERRLPSRALVSPVSLVAAADHFPSQSTQERVRRGKGIKKGMRFQPGMGLKFPELHRLPGLTSM